MILLKGNKYVVMDTDSKETISYHEFDDSRGSQSQAKEDAYASNAVWKKGKVK